MGRVSRKKCCWSGQPDWSYVYTHLHVNLRIDSANWTAGFKLLSVSDWFWKSCCNFVYFFSVEQLQLEKQVIQKKQKTKQPRDEMCCFNRYCDQSKLHLVPFISNGAKSHLLQLLRRFRLTLRPANDDPPAMFCFPLVGPHARRLWWYKYHHKPQV